MMSPYKFYVTAMSLLVLTNCYSYAKDNSDSGAEAECPGPDIDAAPTEPGCYSVIVSTYEDGSTGYTFVQSIDDGYCSYE